ncbi:MAG: hypothetical protein IPL61_36785 [Myxococcales bacterium]|nr:hypothetical protein [Myxococcales bacterium]
MCDEPRGRSTTVHYAAGDLICRATWRSDTPAPWRESIAGVDATCASLRVR